MIEVSKAMYLSSFGCFEVDDFFLGRIEEECVKIEVSSRDCELPQIQTFSSKLLSVLSYIGEIQPYTHFIFHLMKYFA